MNSVVVWNTIEHQLKSIEASERMRELLEIRLLLLKTNYSFRSEFDKNEVEILRLETENKIEKLKNIILNKTTDFNDLFTEYIEELQTENE